MTLSVSSSHTNTNTWLQVPDLSSLKLTLGELVGWPSSKASDASDQEWHEWGTKAQAWAEEHRRKGSPPSPNGSAVVHDSGESIVHTLEEKSPTSHASVFGRLCGSILPQSLRPAAPSHTARSPDAISEKP